MSVSKQLTSLKESGSLFCASQNNKNLWHKIMMFKMSPTTLLEKVFSCFKSNYISLTLLWTNESVILSK